MLERKKQKKNQLKSVKSIRWMEGGGTMEENICGKDEFWAWSEREKEWWMVNILVSYRVALYQLSISYLY